jgi:hypothetical protein
MICLYTGIYCCVCFQLKNNYGNRELAIKRCITVSADKVRGLREQREKSDDSHLLKILRKEQTKVIISEGKITILCL